MLNLQVSAIESGVAQLTDLTGRVIRNLQISSGHADLMQMDLTGVASGTYSVRIISGDKTIAVRKLTVN